MAEDWVVKTQKDLGDVIKAPKLTDKLLQKPPVKFIHDIVTAFIKAKDFPVGLFTAEEMDSANLKERAQKVAFVSKLIAVVQIATGKTTACKAEKVIAGAEPENTNHMFQLLAACAKLPKDRLEAAVQKAVNRRDSNAAEVPPPAPVEAPPAPAPAPAGAAPQRRPSNPSAAAPVAAAPAPVAPPAPAPAPAPVKETAPPPAATPPTPAMIPPTERPQSTAGGRARASDVPILQAVGVIVEGKDSGANDDGGEETAEERGARLLRNLQKKDDAAKALTKPGEAQGYFAKQALQDKEEDEKKLAAAQAADESNQGITMKSRKKVGDKGQRDDIESEIQTLRDQLQTLSKTTNPIGQFMDHVAEDVDMMVRELEQWKGEYKLQIQRYHDAKQETEEDLRALRNQGAEVDQSMQDQVMQTNSLRAVICANDQTIDNLLKMVVNPEGSSGGGAAAKGTTGKK